MWAHHLMGWSPEIELEGESELNTSTRLSLLPDCEHNVISCLTLPLSCLPHCGGLGIRSQQ